MPMNDAPAAPPREPGREPGEAALPRTYALVFVVEAIVIASLYWLGRHFS